MVTAVKTQSVLPATLFISRIVVGALMAAHGWLKFDEGISGFAGTTAALGLPFPELSAWSIAIFEIVTGVLIVVGALTRFSSSLLLLHMMITGIVVILIVQDRGFIRDASLPGPGAELNFLFATTLALIAAIGPGRWSIDAWFADRARNRIPS